MEKQTAPRLRIERVPQSEELEIFVPYGNEEELAFFYKPKESFKVPDFYRTSKNHRFNSTIIYGYFQAKDKITEANLQIPTAEQIIAFLHPIFCSGKDLLIYENPIVKEIRDSITENFSDVWPSIWVFNLNVYTDKGRYIIQDSGSRLPNGTNPHSMDIDDLERYLTGAEEINSVRFSKDGLVRFAPKDSYKFGEHTLESLAKDGGMIAEFGISGMEQILEILESEKNSRITTTKTYGHHFHSHYTFGYDIKEGENPIRSLSKIRMRAFPNKIAFDSENPISDPGDSIAFGLHKRN